jgi:hypothetical protein
MMIDRFFAQASGDDEYEEEFEDEFEDDQGDEEAEGGAYPSPDGEEDPVEGSGDDSGSIDVGGGKAGSGKGAGGAWRLLR